MILSLRNLLVCVFILCCQLQYTLSHHHHRRFHYHTVAAASSPHEFVQHIPLTFKLPRRPPVMDVNNIVRFNLYTRQNPFTPQAIDTSRGLMGLSATNFKTDKKTKILVHGFVDSATDSTTGDWMNDMKDAYLNTQDFNIILMDYSVVAVFLFYWTNLPQLASGRLAELVYILNKSGASYDSFHLIGGSWGSHVAGMAGRTLDGKLGRITGLDPANPPLVKSIGFSYRLDKTDAQFVDVYQLNGKNRLLILNVLGMLTDKYDGLSAPEGTVDIYPNFKQRQITGCPIHNASLYTSSCRLGLGARLFIETIKRNHSFPVCHCDSFLTYLRGECTCDAKNLMYMGNDIPTTAIGVYQLADIDNMEITQSQQQGQESTETILLTSTETPSLLTSSIASTTSNSSNVEVISTTEVSTTEKSTSPVTTSSPSNVSTSIIISESPTSTIEPPTTNKEVVNSDNGQSSKAMARASKGTSSQ